LGVVGRAGPWAAAGGEDRSPGGRSPVHPADPACGHRGLRRDGQGTADPGAAAVPGCGRACRDRLGAAGGLRLDAVPGAAAVLAGARGEAGHRQSRRHGIPDQIGRAGAVRRRPDRAGRRRLSHRAHRAPGSVRPGAGQRVRGVPVGRAAAGARHLGDGVPVLGRRPHRPSSPDALARHQLPGRSG
jgi:hypothetical protein